MKKKVICIVSDNPDIKSYCAKLDEIHKEFEQKMFFIKKQKENAKKTYLNMLNVEFEEINKILKDKGKLPEDFHDNKYKLAYNKPLDVIELHTKDEEDDTEDLPAPIRAFIQAMQSEDDLLN